MIFSYALLSQNNTEALNVFSGGTPRAAIIDQLDYDIPNPSFQTQARQYLETAGYEVDLFTTQNVTVDFYKNLPSMNYQYIVIRSHAVSDKNYDQPVTLFTGERYTTDKYISEQLFGQLKRGTPTLERAILAKGENYSNWIKVNDTYSYMKAEATISEKSEDFFLITPKLVDELMVGKFPKSTILLGGCSTLANPSLAESLIKRGASQIVGWSDFVSSSDNDWLLLKVLQLDLLYDHETEDAVRYAQEVYTINPIWPATLKFYSEKNL